MPIFKNMLIFLAGPINDLGRINFRTLIEMPSERSEGSTFRNGSLSFVLSNNKLKF